MYPRHLLIRQADDPGPVTLLVERERGFDTELWSIGLVRSSRRTSHATRMQLQIGAGVLACMHLVAWPICYKYGVRYPACMDMQYRICTQLSILIRAGDPIRGIHGLSWFATSV